MAAQGRGDEGATFDARRTRDAGSRGPLEQAAIGARPVVANQETTWPHQGRVHTYPSRIILPLLRGTTVIGLADLHSDSENAFVGWSPERLRTLDAIFRPLVDAHESTRVRRVLERTAEFRVNLRASEQEVLDNIIVFVSHSSDMQYVALRQFEPPARLTAIRQKGLPGSDSDLSFLDFERNYRPFAHVVTHKKEWVATDLSGNEYDAIKAQPELSDVRSFVACPVLVGNRLWGVLSFAAAVEYEYSRLEVYALRVLANLAGASLDAVNTADRAMDDIFSDVQLFQANMSAELVAATRHEINDQLEVIGNSRTALNDVFHPLRTDSSRTKRLTLKELEHLGEIETDLDRAHADLNKIMDTIRITQQPVDTTLEAVNIKRAWDRAAEPFRYRRRRLRVTRIEPRLSPSLEAPAAFDLLRIVFMHLILNSFDAFERRRGSAKREILLEAVRPRSPDEIRLRYRDTAGGVYPNTLMRRGELVTPDEDVRDAVFERFVTSKSRGTGIGLASCRAALKAIGGGIELVDYADGMVFDLTLSTTTG